MFVQVHIMFTVECLLWCLVQNFFQFVHEGVYILEFTVDRGKAYIGYSVQVFEFVHDDFTDFGAWYFTIFFVEDFGFDLVQDLFNLLYGNRTFVAGTHDAVLDFGAVVLFAALVFFDNNKWNCLYFLVSGEPLAALVTLSSPSDGIIVRNRSGIDDACVVLITKWTFHVKVLLDLCYIRLPAVNIGYRAQSESTGP